MTRTRKRLQDVIWLYRVRKALRITKNLPNAYGQFLSVIGFYIAQGHLPADVLDRFGLRLTDTAP